MRWRNMAVETPAFDGPDFLALGNEGVALVWFAPEMGAKWAIMDIPGRGIRVSHALTEFHSWCPVREWHRHTNMLVNPSYYGK